MTRLRVLLSRLLDLIFTRRRDERLDEEIRTHLELMTEDFVAHGLSRAEAARAARRAFGRIDTTKATVREQRGLPRLDTLLADLRFAIRLLQRDRGFTATAALVLALGIGVNNMLFAILNAHTLRGLPIPQPDRILSVSTLNDLNQERGLSYAELQDLRSSTESFDSVLAFAQMPVVLSGDGRPAERLDAAFLSGDVASVTSRRPHLGRGFLPEDDQPGAPRMVILGSRAWDVRFDGDASVLGQSVLVDGQPATIIGVMDDRTGLPTTAAVWLPLTHMPGLSDDGRGDRRLTVVARLARDVAQADAAAEVHLVGERWSRDHPDTNGNVRARVAPINSRYFGNWNDPVWLAFMTAGILVALISSANVANLMLGRTAQRRRELAVRASLGATRRRLIRQMLIEGSLLAGIGCIVGLGLAVAGLKLFRSAMPEDALPYWVDYSPDLRVLTALVLVSVATVFVFALLPAAQASRTDVSQVLKDGGRTARRPTQAWTTAFLAAEIALGMVLMAQVAITIRSRPAPWPSDQAIDTRQVLTASVTLSGDRYLSPEQRVAFYEQLGERLRALPDVASMSVASTLPVSGGPDVRVDVAGHPPVEPDAQPVARLVAIGPRYFETLALPLVRGRELTESDDAASIVVNQEFVRRLLAGVEPIGHRVVVRGPQDGDEAPGWSTIVGVAPDIRQRPRSEPEPVVYVPYSRSAAATATLLVRSHVEREDLASRLRGEVAAIDSGLPLYRVSTLAEVAWNATWNGRLSRYLILTLTLIAVGLAAVGLYAVTMHAVTRRTHEIGVRMALGARPRQVAALIVRRALVQLAFGLLAGAVCIRVWAALFASGSARVSASDLEALVLVSAVLVAITLLACAIPVRRAVRLDPVAAIRHE